MKQVNRPSTEKSRAKYSKLRSVLENIAGEKGLDFHVEEWCSYFVVTPKNVKPFVRDVPLNKPAVTAGETYEGHQLIGYKIEKGYGAAEDSWKRNVLLAEFVSPEEYGFSKREAFILDVNYEERYFESSELEKRLASKFPNRRLYLNWI